MAICYVYFYDGKVPAVLPNPTRLSVDTVELTEAFFILKDVGTAEVPGDGKQLFVKVSDVAAIVGPLTDDAPPL